MNRKKEIHKISIKKSLIANANFCQVPLKISLEIGAKEILLTTLDFSDKKAVNLRG